MQYINLNKILELENKIQDLLLISIDDQIDTINDKEGIRMNGVITISGEVKTLEGDKKFDEQIDLDVFLTDDEILDRNGLSISINDFNYDIDDNKLILDISLKVEGLKEIEATFPSQEDNEDFSNEEIESIEASDDEKRVYIDENIDLEKKESEECKKIVEEEKELEEQEEIKNARECLGEEIEERDDEKEENKEIVEEERKLEEQEEIKGDWEYEEEERENIHENKEMKKSLLKSVFSSKRIKEEVSWKLHCVKNETSYEEIASKYNINLSKLVAINNNEPIGEGKLIFLPLD